MSSPLIISPSPGHTPIHYRTIARIVGRKFGDKTDHKRIQRFLARHPLPVQLPLPVTSYHQFDDAYRARWTVVRMFYEGWHQTSTAGVLKLSRQHVGHILQAFQRDSVAGLEDQRTQHDLGIGSRAANASPYDVRTGESALVHVPVRCNTAIASLPLLYNQAVHVAAYCNCHTPGPPPNDQDK
jgi:hypothetical protein